MRRYLSLVMTVSAGLFVLLGWLSGPSTGREYAILSLAVVSGIFFALDWIIAPRRRNTPMMGQTTHTDATQASEAIFGRSRGTYKGRVQPNQHFYLAERDAIQRFYRDFCQISVKMDEQAPILNPGTVRYRFRLTSRQATVAKIASRLDQLTDYLAEFRASSGVTMFDDDGDPIEMGVSLSTRPPLSFIVNKPPADVDTLFWERRNSATQELRPRIGRVFAGAEATDAMINFTNPYENNMLVLANPGGGKNCLIDALVASLVEVSGPERVNFLHINTDNSSFLHYNRLPHVVGFARTNAGCVSCLQFAEAEMNTRKEDDESYPALFILIDEFHVFTQGADPVLTKKVNDILRGIANRGRKRKVFLVLASQRPKAVTPDIREVSKIKCIGLISQEDEKTIFGDNAYGAASLRNPGEFILERPKTGGQLIQAYYIEEMAEAIQQFYPASHHEPWCFDRKDAENTEHVMRRVVEDSAHVMMPTADVEMEVFPDATELYLEQEEMEFIQANASYRGGPTDSIEQLRKAIRLKNITRFYTEQTGLKSSGEYYTRFCDRLRLAAKDYLEVDHHV